jgi:hypothetical protein
MISLFRRIQPAQQFHLNARHLAHVLKIRHLVIVRIEYWAYILFVHRHDKGGQFVSYRQLNLWMRKISRMIQTSPTLEYLQQLGLGIKQETEKFADRYSAKELDYLRQIWAERRDQLRRFPEAGDAANYTSE